MIQWRPVRGAAAALALLTTPAWSDDRPGAVYDSEADAATEIDAALAAAQARGAATLIVFGANWCHDSRGLAAHLAEDPALDAFMAEAYETIFVDIGERDRNLDQLARFGVEAVYGTPTPVIVSAAGQPVAAQTVHAWRTAYDAASADLATYLARHAGAAAAPITADASVDLAAAADAWPSYQAALGAIETLPQADQADARAFARGMAVSLARLSLGRVSHDLGYAAADRADLEALQSEPGVDLDGAVADRLSTYDRDLVAQWRAQRD